MGILTQSFFLREGNPTQSNLAIKNAKNNLTQSYETETGGGGKIERLVWGIWRFADKLR